MTKDIWVDTVKFLYQVENSEKVERKKVAEPTIANRDGIVKNKTVVNKEKKVGRNDPCPCGSGKKYKKCCGR